MNDALDPNQNHVTFHVMIKGKEIEVSGVGPTRAVDCVEAIWNLVSQERALKPSSVRQIYSEWEPSKQDQEFLDRTFPEDAELAFTFKRPRDDSWPAAIQAAAKVIQASGLKRPGSK